MAETKSTPLGISAKRALTFAKDLRALIFGLINTEAKAQAP